MFAHDDQGYSAHDRAVLCRKARRDLEAAESYLERLRADRSASVDARTDAAWRTGFTRGEVAMYCE